MITPTVERAVPRGARPIQINERSTYICTARPILSKTGNLIGASTTVCRCSTFVISVVRVLNTTVREFCNFLQTEHQPQQEWGITIHRAADITKQRNSCLTNFASSTRQFQNINSMFDIATQRTAQIDPRPLCPATKRLLGRVASRRARSLITAPSLPIRRAIPRINP